MFFSYGIQIWTDISSVLSQCTRVTDRRTDGRTDRILIARPRLHCMQRGKNCLNLNKQCKYHFFFHVCVLLIQLQFLVLISVLKIVKLRIIIFI